MSEYLSVPEVGYNFMTRHLWPSTYKPQAYTKGQSLIPLLKNREHKGWTHTALLPIFGLVRVTYSVGLTFLTPVGVIKEGVFLARDSIRWIKFKPNRPNIEKEIKARLLAFSINLFHSTLLFFAVRVVIWLFHQKGYLTEAFMRQLPQILIRHSEKALVTLPLLSRAWVLAAADMCGTRISFACLVILQTYCAFPWPTVATCNSVPDCQILTPFLNSEGRRELELKIQAGIVYDSKSAEYPLEQVETDYRQVWVELLESVRKARLLGHRIPDKVPLHVCTISHYISSHGAEFDPDLHEELQRNCTLVMDLACIREVMYGRYIAGNPTSPVQDQDKYFPEVPPEHNRSERQPKPIPVIGAVMKVILSSSWLCPSNVQERQIRDRGIIDSSLEGIDLSEGRIVKGAWHQWTKPLRLLARAVCYAVATAFLAPLGFVWRMGLAGRGVVSIVTKKPASSEEIWQHGHCALIDGVHAIFGITMAATLATRIKPSLLQNKLIAKIATTDARFWTLFFVIHGSVSLGMTLAPKATLHAFFQRRFVERITRSHLLKQNEGIVSTYKRDLLNSA